MTEIIEGIIEPRIIPMWDHTGWGNAIYFINWEERKVAGHLYPIPEKGDILRSKMESGSIARFEVNEVTQPSNPKDMFFATVTDLGYE